MPSAIDTDPFPDEQPDAQTPLRPPVSPITPVPRFAQLASQSGASSTEELQHVPSLDDPVSTSAPAPVLVPSPPASFPASAFETHNQHDPTAITTTTPPPRPHHTPDPLPDLPLPTPVPPEEDPHASSYQIDQPPLSTSAPQFLPPPSPTDLPLEDNTDYIAVRAALNILQMQRDKSRRDLRTLSSLQTSLSQDPDRFYQQVRAQGNLRHRHPPDDPLRATWEDMTMDDTLSSTSSDSDGDDTRPPPPPAENSEDKLPKIPSKQNIVRCPPVNWAKYHIVGETLDKMHEDQRRRPTTYDPDRDETRGAAVAEGFRPGYRVLGTLHERERERERGD